MTFKRRNAGFTLIELMIVVAIIAIIAAVAIPKLMSARISANENAAIATLRSIAAAQQQIQSACAIDTNADGGGEYAFFAELSGEAPLRIYDPAVPGPAPGVAGADELNPPFLATAFGDTVADANGDGVIARQGYYFKIFLPSQTAGGLTDALAEDSTGLGAKVADVVPATWASDNCEILWSCYAWPVDAQKTGNRVFFINQEGDLMQYHNRDEAYEALAIATIPTFDAALSDEMGGSTFDAPLGLAAMGKTSEDGNVWTAVGN